jgi:hypothetical protein
MQVVLKSGATKKKIKEIEEVLHKKKNSGGFNAKRYNGTVPMKKDALTIQKKLRDEWEREIR